MTERPHSPDFADEPAGAQGPRIRPVVVLVGVPGAGKSTVGRALAARLDLGFRDTDLDVESSTGRAIADIFVQSGEPEFRRLEAAAVATALREHAGVLALGGGAVMDRGTRGLLAGGPIVWLRVGLAAASHRAGLSGARPVLLGNVRAQMKGLMDTRAPLYEEVSRLIVDTDSRSVAETVEAILAGLILGATPSGTSGATSDDTLSGAPGATPEDRDTSGMPRGTSEDRDAPRAYATGPEARS